VRGGAATTASVTVFFWGVLGLVWGLLSRTLPAASTEDWLSGNSELPWWPSAPLFGLCVWSALILLTVGEALRRRSWSIFLSGGVAAFSTAIVAGAVGHALVPLLDSGFRPLFEPIVGKWAAGGWAILGGLTGATYGTLRRLRDVFSTRLVQILAGWFFFLVIMAAMLWTMRAVATHAL
jgi:hypothetical protein